ncbi:uncharacterized protein LOC127838017 [Dreissena polymorpha]|nr:uncharacterized protein LOC127838017 [Dreissena polymorpha]
MATIENIKMDNIGKLLNERDASSHESSIYHSNGSALSFCVLSYYRVEEYIFNAFFLSGPSFKSRITEFENKFTLLEKYNRAPLEKYKKYDYVFHSIMSDIACLGASLYLEQRADGREYNHDVIKKARQLYLQSLESDIIGNYMRYASFLFCNGEFDEACKYFDLIEKQIEADTKSNLILQFLVSPSESLALQIANHSCGLSYKQKWSVFLIFRQEDAMCVPEFLRCEMYRRLCGINTPTRLPFYYKEECMCVQIEPYLYYLQYLTYRELHREPQQSQALRKLSRFTEIMKPTRIISPNGDIFLSFAHFDASLNMLGHCLELEQKLKSALNTYKASLQMVPQKNAAVLHIIRLLWPVVQSLWAYGHLNNTLEVTNRK